jgi:hypothetical protein
MRAIHTAFVLAVLSAAPLAAQVTPHPAPSTPGRPNDTRPWVPGRGGLAVRNPQFADFAVQGVFHGKAAAPVLSTATARRHGTAIRQGVANGANFAGRYAIVTWGCGTSCQRFALVDVRTGHVSVSPMRLVRGAEFRANSTLFIANPADEATRQRCGSSPASPCPSFLMLRNGRLVPLDTPPNHP